MQRTELKNIIDRPNYKSEHIATFQNAKEIIAQLKRAELESRRTSAQLAKVFNESDKMNVAAKVYYFLRHQIFYKAEPKSNQTAKTISRFVNDATGDCKHFSVFAVGVLNACGIPAWFTFIGQFKDNKRPNHAYCTCLIDNKPVIIDPCRKYFNSEARYFYKWDVKRV